MGVNLGSPFLKARVYGLTLSLVSLPCCIALPPLVEAMGLELLEVAEAVALGIPDDVDLGVCWLCI